MTDQKKYTTKLSGKHVLIIGGSSGIGFAVAEACLEQGASVTISSSKQSRIEEAIERLSSAYPTKKEKIAGYPCNLGEESTLESNVETLFQKTGKVDHIVFTAGDPLAILPLHDATVAKIKQAGLVRFFAPLIVAKVGSKYISKGPESSIILTTGSVSERPNPNWSIVGSFATGLQGMTRGLALDLKPVRVNLVSPGMVETELWDTVPKEMREHMMKERAAALPTGAIGQAEDVAEAYLYLLKDKNITGSMISTNGGGLLV